MTDTCPKCGETLKIGSWPYCKGGHGSGFSNVVPDEYSSPQVLENIGHTPVTVYTRSERKRLLKEHNLDEFVRHVGVNGTDKSYQTTNWNTPSPKTLEDGKALVAQDRRAVVSGNIDSPTINVTFTVRELL